MPEQQSTSRGGLVGTLLGFFSGLRFPWLFGLFTLVFGVDLVVPDLLPFVDEIMLGLGTMLLGSWRKRKETKVTEVAAQPTLPPADKASF